MAGVVETYELSAFASYYVVSYQMVTFPLQLNFSSLGTVACITNSSQIHPIPKSPKISFFHNLCSPIPLTFAQSPELILPFTVLTFKSIRQRNLNFTDERDFASFGLDFLHFSTGAWINGCIELRSGSNMAKTRGSIYNEISHNFNGIHLIVNLRKVCVCSMIRD